MTPRPFLTFALLLTLGVALPVIAGPLSMEPEGNPTLREPLAFDHNVHGPVFDGVHLSCVDCHPIGLSILVDGVPTPRVEPLPTPRSACHGCHRAQVRGAPRKAPGTCMLCHAVRSELEPPSHSVGWLSEHALEARTGLANCQDCHEPSSCVACHERRGPGARSPHEPGFLSIHGVEARLDPLRCSSCHAGETCNTCHATGNKPW